MSQRPFRFIHAADLHLDEPVEGLADVPEHLTDVLVDCGLQAARRVFDSAVEQQVDFVVLSGDVVDLQRGSPRELTFLVEQFERLAGRNIAVYWAGGEIDSVDWPARFSLPGNVKQASRLHVQRQRHEIAGAPICELAGRSRERGELPKAYEFANSKDDLFSIVVAHAEFSGGLGDLGVNYWALGGQHKRSTLLQSQKSVAHHPGTPQGRRPSETGAHGCTLVRVDEYGQVQLTPITTDVVRWERQRLTLSVSADRAELARLLRDRTEQLLGEAGGAALLIEWQIVCEGSLFTELRQGKLAADLLGELQRDFGHRSNAAWSVSVQPELPLELPAVWQREETLRGDFLRAIQNLIDAEHVDSDGKSPGVDIDGLLLQGCAAERFSQLNRLLTALDDAVARRRVFCEAAWLGADLLSAEEAVK